MSIYLNRLEQAISNVKDSSLKNSLLNRYKKVPWRWASSKTDMLTIEEDYQDLMPIIIENDEELKEMVEPIIQIG